MATALINFPLALATDGIISYIQYLFGSSEHTPSEYRWDQNERSSRITISGPFVVDGEKPNSAPYIIVERGGFSVNKAAIDDTKSAKENTFEDIEGVMINDGAIVLTIGSTVASEASSIANYLMIQLQADRHEIMDTMGFLRNFNALDVSPEEPVIKEAEIKRWKVVVKFQASIQMGWIKKNKEDKWQKFSVRAKEVKDYYESDGCLVLSNTDTITDSNADFGYSVENTPNFIESEFDKGWYYLQFDGETTVYDVVEIVNSNTLRLEKDGLPFNPDESENCKKYRLFWNAVHLHVEI